MDLKTFTAQIELMHQEALRQIWQRIYKMSKL